MIRMGAACAEANSIGLPSGIQRGDLMLIFAFRDGSATNPTVPAGWTTLTNTLDGTSCSAAIGWRRYQPGDTSGTWANATALALVVYRGAQSDGEPVGTPQTSVGTTSPSTYAAVATGRGGSSWIAAFQGHRSVDTTALTTPPTGLTNVASALGATCDVVVHDSNGPISDRFVSATVAPGGTASGWITAMVEIFSRAVVLNNYHSPRVGAGMGTGERVC